MRNSWTLQRKQQQELFRFKMRPIALTEQFYKLWQAYDHWQRENGNVWFPLSGPQYDHQLREEMTNKEITKLQDRYDLAASLIERFLKAVDDTPTTLHMTNRNPGRDAAIRLISDARQFLHPANDGIKK